MLYLKNVYIYLVFEGSVEKGAEEMNNSDCSEHEDLNKKKKKKEDPSTPLKGGARPSRPASGLYSIYIYYRNKYRYI